MFVHLSIQRDPSYYKGSLTASDMTLHLCKAVNTSESEVCYTYCGRVFAWRVSKGDSRNKLPKCKTCERAATREGIKFR